MLLIMGTVAYGLDLRLGARFVDCPKLRMMFGWWRGALVLAGYGEPPSNKYPLDLVTMEDLLDRRRQPTLWPSIGWTPQAWGWQDSRVWSVAWPIWLALVVGAAVAAQPLLTASRVRRTIGVALLTLGLVVGALACCGPEHSVWCGQRALCVFDPSLTASVVACQRYELQRGSGPSRPLYLSLPPPGRAKTSVPVAALALPLIAGGAWLARAGRQRQPEQCRCGYDLTGNVSGRCPECGRAASPKSAGTGNDGFHHQGHERHEGHEGS